jgi:hypothetical protein
MFVSLGFVVQWYSLTAGDPESPQFEFRSPSAAAKQKQNKKQNKKRQKTKTVCACVRHITKDFCPR